jgi:cytochrome c peroxidase
LAYATTEITEQRIQFAIAYFVRSIQSFDSRFDIGMQMVDSAPFPFPNYRTTENLGENIFTGYENSGTGNA